MMVLEQAIAQSASYDVSKTAEDLPTALACAEAAFDVAVLDVNLNGSSLTPWPIAWSSWGVPFLFTTGLGANRLPERFQRARPSLKSLFA